MQNIQMVDLVGQYEKIKDLVNPRIQQVIETAAFINGPEVKRFQEELESYLGVKHVIPCANGTDALQIAMMALGLKPGDEVITTTFTFVATAEVIAILGLTPVLVDCDEDTFLISTDAVKEAITEKTKAIIPVHLFGQCANMDEIMEIAKAHQLKVIEDGAQSIGADFYFKNGSVKKSGTIGDFGCTSFFPSKNLGCYGDGGALFTNNDQLAEKARMIVNHGMKVRYYHDEIGVNSRLDSIQAAVLSVKLERLDDYCNARRKAADYYDAAFKSIDAISTPKRVENSSHVFHQYTLKIKGVNREELQKFLSDNGIPAMIYYPVPLHQQKAYRDERYLDGHFPIAEKLSKAVLSLPMHTELTEGQLKYITDKVKEFIKK
ncbi:MAG: DegT/DnrJ/EryC1/StrS family aminotransferase [Bacteroidetes bacterium]|nr:MAG: DegT/DnrJ/EryC1/StrS family aminotransferase [Bacteroidota bacterium]MBL1145592.1 DegT/DnrJ/EryC1/StrS family aminotransferase [Bacteroidota bacterium]NOG58388.1 DegT/DnrJ/EryC1/StrS family aminotransferase [Bacteroidota bacterium]